MKAPLHVEKANDSGPPGPVYHHLGDHRRALLAFPSGEMNEQLSGIEIEKEPLLARAPFFPCERKRWSSGRASPVPRTRMRAASSMLPGREAAWWHFGPSIGSAKVRGFSSRMIPMSSHDLRHGVTLETILRQLRQHYGLALADRHPLLQQRPGHQVEPGLPAQDAWGAGEGRGVVRPDACAMIDESRSLRWQPPSFGAGLRLVAAARAACGSARRDRQRRLRGPGLAR
jgi:hypothetical protein